MVTEATSFDPRVVGYPDRMSMYLVPPPYELNLEDFETMALDRLKVLKAIETATIRNSLKKDRVYNPNVIAITKEHMPLSRQHNLSNKKSIHNERKRDHCSHFILRLAFCQTLELRSWFLKLETELFKLRLAEEDSKDISNLIKLINFDGSAIKLVAQSKSEKKQDRDDNTNLFREIQLFYNLNEKEVEALQFYKVPFENVIEQIRARQVIVKDGFAYVPSSLQNGLLVNLFKENLEAGLDATAKALPAMDMDEDDRIGPILNSLSKQHLSNVANSYVGENTGTFNHTEIDALSASHFAPCMKNLHLNMRANSHLRHFGRLQYGLFLKAIGLPYEEALTFWRKAFNRMTDEQFQKGGHVYNIRHSFGLEGKRQNYTSYSCMKIITSNQPGAGDHHGCPFRHFSQDNVRSMITEAISNGEKAAPSSTIVQAGVTDVMKLTKDGHFQLACTRLFELSRSKGEGGSMSIDTIEHPLQFFNLSIGVPKQDAIKLEQTSASNDVTVVTEAMDIVVVEAVDEPKEGISDQIEDLEMQA